MLWACPAVQRCRCELKHQRHSALIALLCSGDESKRPQLSPSLEEQHKTYSQSYRICKPAQTFFLFLFFNSLETCGQRQPSQTGRATRARGVTTVVVLCCFSTCSRRCSDEKQLHWMQQLGCWNVKPLTLMNHKASQQ